MTNPTPPLDEQAESFDRIALDLQELRESAGSVSYAELVRRITALRLDRGVPAAAAVPARSTVYNAFRTGRARLDIELLRDIVVALGADEQQVAVWMRRCREARRTTDATARADDHERPRAGQSLPRIRTAKPTTAAVVLLLVVCVTVNLLGLYTSNVFRLSVYLDMVGTAIAAIVLGPWHGVAVAIASNGLGILTGDPHTIPFMPVNVVGALVWGYGIRRLRMGSNLTRYISLNLCVAIACSLVAAPIVATVFHGGAGHASEQAVLSLQAWHLPFLASVFSTNIITSIVDKLQTGFIALVVFTLLHSRMSVPASHMPLVEKVAALRIAPPADLPRRLPSIWRKVLESRPNSGTLRHIDGRGFDPGVDPDTVSGATMRA